MLRNQVAVTAQSVTAPPPRSQTAPQGLVTAGSVGGQSTSVALAGVIDPRRWLRGADDWIRRGVIAPNRRVQDYFQHRPGDLLVLNVADPDAMERLCAFVGVEYRVKPCPN